MPCNISIHVTVFYDRVTFALDIAVYPVIRKIRDFCFSDNYYNSAKDVPHFCKWGPGLITGGEHISRLVEMPQRKVCLWQTLIEGIIKIHNLMCFGKCKMESIYTLPHAKKSQPG